MECLSIYIRSFSFLYYLETSVISLQSGFVHIQKVDCTFLKMKFAHIIFLIYLCSQLWRQSTTAPITTAATPTSTTSFCHPQNHYCHRPPPNSTSDPSLTGPPGEKETGEKKTTEGSGEPLTANTTSTSDQQPPDPSSPKTLTPSNSSVLQLTSDSTNWRNFYLELEGSVALVDEAILLFVTSEENPPNSLAQLIAYTSRQSLTLSFIHQVFLTLGAAVLNIALVLSLKHCCCCRKKRSTLASTPAPPARAAAAPADAFNQFREQRQGRQAFEAAGNTFELAELCRKKDAEIAQLKTAPVIYQQPHYACPSVSLSAHPPSAHYAAAGIGIVNHSYEDTEGGFDNPIYGNTGFQRQALEAAAPPPGGSRLSFRGPPGVQRQAPPPPEHRQPDAPQHSLGARPKTVHFRSHRV